MQKIKTIFLRHLFVGFMAILTVYAFWLSRPEWSFEMRLWRSFGDAGFIFLMTVLAIGPLSRTWRVVTRLMSWRREIGIWFAVLAIIHSILVLNGWVRWSVMRFLGYEFLPQFDRWARLEPGFGIANIIGLVALFWIIALMATSSAGAIRLLGASTWKWLHYGAYVIFYLITIHIAYFMFIHYTLSFHRLVPDPNWFRYYFLVMALTIFALQVSAFIKTVFRQEEKH